MSGPCVRAPAAPAAPLVMWPGCVMYCRMSVVKCDLRYDGDAEVGAAWACSSMAPSARLSAPRGAPA